MPSATSRPTEPVGTTGISSCRDSPSLRRMMAPLPNSFSTPAMASSRALLRVLSSMVQRLLFFPILRTRSASKKLVARAVIVFPALVLTLAAGCDRGQKPEVERAPEQAKPPENRGGHAGEPPPAEKEELARLEAEAGIDLSTDPAPPSGDLKQDVDSFTTLDACVRKR